MCKYNFVGNFSRTVKTFQRSRFSFTYVEYSKRLSLSDDIIRKAKHGAILTFDPERRFLFLKGRKIQCNISACIRDISTFAILSDKKKPTQKNIDG